MSIDLNVTSPFTCHQVSDQLVGVRQRMGRGGRICILRGISRETSVLVPLPTQQRYPKGTSTSTKSRSRYCGGAGWSVCAAPVCLPLWPNSSSVLADSLPRVQQKQRRRRESLWRQYVRGRLYGHEQRDQLEQHARRNDF